MELEVSSSSSGPGNIVRGKDKVEANGTYLIWEDLTVIIPNFGEGPTKRLIQELQGFAEPGKTLAIMGPSGSGKSTLLDALAGRLAKNVILTGKVLFNGNEKRRKSSVAYVTQEDVLMSTLTVRETLAFSANLRLPATMGKKEIEEVVEGTIAELGLHDCADRKVGNWHLRGLSGGEKKRLSIGIEILTKPNILFLDEPTSGLDSASAFFVVHTLRSIARDRRTVICSIHQPSSEVFAQFDNLYLLSGGNNVYFGDACKALEFFEEAGFPCPPKRNPSDHFLRCINSDFDHVASALKQHNNIHFNDPFHGMSVEEIKERLIAKYGRSNNKRSVRSKIEELSKRNTDNESKYVANVKPSEWKQLKTLTRRSLINMSRDIGYYWARLVVYVILSVCVGSIFYDVGYGYSSILARVSCGGFIIGFMTFLSIGGFPSFIEEMKVFYRENLSGHYGVTLYVLSNSLSSFPFIAMISLASGTICYYMVKFRQGFPYFAHFLLTMLGCISVVETMMMVVASLVPNFLMGLITGAGLLGIMMMASGFFRLLSDLPKPFWRYPFSYINYDAWALQGAYKNFFLGLEFAPLDEGGVKISGEFVVTRIFGTPIKYSKWWDLAAVSLLLVCYKMLFLVVLKFKERAMPIVNDHFTKKVIDKLAKRASFRKLSSFSSSRRHHRLATLEELESPCHF